MTIALALFLGLSGVTVQGHRLVARDDDPDEIEINGTDLKNANDVGLYAKTFLAEGKSIQKINQEEEDKKNASDESFQDRGKAIDEISKQVSMNQMMKPPMIERAQSSPTHIEITVPRNPEKP